MTAKHLPSWEDFLAENRLVENWLLYPEHTSEEVREVITSIENLLPPHLQAFLQLRRKYRHCRGRRGWVKQIQSELPEVLAYRTGKAEESLWRESRTTFYQWWQVIVKVTARTAAKKGLL